MTRVTEPRLTPDKERSDMLLNRTISAMVGKGSVNHNSRKFNAKNTDPERTHLNISFCNDDIKTVYHELFDEALQKYNEKQTRSDRCIDNYYEKIRIGKQEKPFHELILQIGNCEDTAVGTETAEKATEALKDYYAGFQERNPQLRVFSAHIHLDEHTPHIHIDFVPFTTGSKRGLETRVSLKQALYQQEFEGEGKRDTEWNRWVQSEKEELALAMEKYDLEWEQKGTHEEHLSDYDYKKKMRSEEVKELTEKTTKLKDRIERQETKLDEMEITIQNYTNGKKELNTLQHELDTSPEYALPEPDPFMTARNYIIKYAEPLIKKLKKLVVSVLAKYYTMEKEFHRMESYYNSSAREIGRLKDDNYYLNEKNETLQEENKILCAENKNFAFLKRTLGEDRMKNLMKEAREIHEQKLQHKMQCKRDLSYER